MKLINRGDLAADNIPPDILDKLLEIKAIHAWINEDDFNFLIEFGILRSGLVYRNGTIVDGTTSYSVDLNDEPSQIALRNLLGKELLHAI